MDRKTAVPPALFVPHVYISICGGIQPGILRRALGDEHRESGLAARLLLACPPRKAKRWTEADIDPAAEEEMNRLFDQLYSLQSDAGERCRTACPVDAAAGAWCGRGYFIPRRGGGGRVRALLPHADCEVIAGCKHCPPTTEEFRTWLGTRLTNFFTANAETKHHGGMHKQMA